jgi:hypothetical protein
MERRRVSRRSSPGTPISKSKRYEVASGVNGEQKPAPDDVIGAPSISIRLQASLLARETAGSFSPPFFVRARPEISGSVQKGTFARNRAI